MTILQVSEFADKLIQEMGGSVKDERDEPQKFSIPVKNWTKMGNNIQSIINITPYFKYLLGSFMPGINGSLS